MCVFTSQARSEYALKITLIIDKMDSAKNHVPWFSDGRKPKDIDPFLRDVLKLHVTGVIIHGKPDKRFLFWALPYLPGNANLNIECLRRALVHHLSGLSFKPKLYLQFDNASDNRNLTVLGLCGWLVEQGYVSQVQTLLASTDTPHILESVSMCCATQVEICTMMPGHTHEDIDAMFRFIADALRAEGLIRTIDEFERAARQAFRTQAVHVEHVATVHDYTTWLKPKISVIEHIKTARYFVIGLREPDRLPVMWYKPCVAHGYLYPTSKDETSGMPKQSMVNGEKVYQTDPAGIEIFDELPMGEPGIQEFEDDRLDLEGMHSLIKEIASMQPLLFDENVKEWWADWAESTPTTAEEAVRKYGLHFTWPSPAANWQPPTLDGLRSEYEETVTYVNKAGGQTFTTAQCAQAEVEQNDKRPDVSSGDLLVVIPGSDDGMHRLPFWLAEVTDPAPPAQDSIQIVWRAPFKNGYMKDDLTAQWLQLCTGCVEARGGRVRYHACTTKCRSGIRDKAGHGAMKGMVQRDQIALYFAQLTKGKKHM